MTRIQLLCLLTCLSPCTAAQTIPEVRITGRIDGPWLRIGLDFEAEVETGDLRMLLLRGEAVLDPCTPLPAGAVIDYDPNDRAYYVQWSRPGHHRMSTTFLVQGVVEPNGPWRQASVQAPQGRVRIIRMTSDQPDLEVQLPGALRVTRSTAAGQLVVEALLGPAEPLVVLWKPQVQLADAKLVLSSQANTVVDVRPGLVQTDTVFDFQVSQGRIERLAFQVPGSLRITAVEGVHIRTWSVQDANDATRTLAVDLSRAQDKAYRLRVRAEVAVDRLPAEVLVPVLAPAAGIRAGGHLTVGTDSALQLVVLEASGLTQIDGAAFPRVQAQDRAVPQAKAFFYVYAGSQYRLRLSVDDIVAAYDVAARVTIRVKEEDLLVDVDLDLDVRDAPLGQLEVLVPPGLVVAAVDGNQVDDYHLSDAQGTDRPTTVQVVFKAPVIGRTLVHLGLELGRGPLGQDQVVRAARVTGAKAQRGYVVVAVEPGIELDQPQAQDLREVHTASVPLRVALAQYAYRFREADWHLTLHAQRKSAGIRAEVFHIQSIGEALAYGSAAINYLITGSPVDCLRFRLPAGFENVEFVGSDVRSASLQDGLWQVRLTRKVLGDYNLAVTYTQRYGPDRPIQLGALQCQDVQAQTGYVVVTSHMDLDLRLLDPNSDQPSGLLPVALDELTGDLRLLTSGPVLAAYKYVQDPHAGRLAIDPFPRSGLLPVVVDIADLQTRLSVQPDGRIESVTTVQYKVKNTRRQFLALTLAPEARIWSVRIMEDGDRSTRLAASHDQKTGRLLVPLHSRANPNDPATIEVRYGQVHPDRTWWRRPVELSGPGCEVPIAYANWQVQAPRTWAITPAGGTMHAQMRTQARAGLAPVARQAANLWGEGLDRVAADEAFWVTAVLMAVLAIGIGIFRRRWLPEWMVLCVLGLVTWVGVYATLSGDLQAPAAPASAGFAQAVSVDPDQALQVRAELVPAWRHGLTVLDLIVPALVAAVGTVVALRWSRLRRAGWAAVATAAVLLAAEVPVLWPVLEALVTWAVPACAILWFGIRRARLAAVTAIAVGVTVGGCATGPGPVSHRPAIEQLHCSMAAGQDHVEMAYTLRITTPGPAQWPIAQDTAILTSSPEPASHVKIETVGGRHVLIADRAVTCTVRATFLAPLPDPGPDQQRRFALDLPLALTNRISMAVPDANWVLDAPGAVAVTERHGPDRSELEALFTPGRPAVFTWRPRERQAAQEEVRFYAQDIGLAVLSSGLVQVSHGLGLRIAQGQVDQVRVGIPSGHTVTSVTAPGVGAWRFDPGAHQLEIRLTEPATGAAELILVTQAARAGLPYDLSLEPVVVGGALDQHSVMGLACDSSVYVRVDRHPAAMNVHDYLRDSDTLIRTVPGLTGAAVTQAYRFDGPGLAVQGQVLAMQSEVRSQETARFNVEDDRLVYNSQWAIEITKAGRFDVDLLLPDGFDIDTLEAEAVSHWDETTENGQRQVRVHFLRKLVGTVALHLALSRPIAEIPELLTAPQVRVAGSLKHTGCLVVGAEQGVRVSVTSRQGVSEINPVEAGQTDPGLLAFRLLRPDWQLGLQTEQIQPRVTVEGLHVARVTDGLVHHQHILRYRLYHAGVKTFDLDVPAEATGVQITGPGIARREQTGPGRWRVELDDKVTDRPYRMTVTYQTQYDPADGRIALRAVQCRAVDLQQGYTVVFATDRLSLTAEAADAILRPADARAIPDAFLAGDLSGAALCYRSVSVPYTLQLQALRHAAAQQMGAEVLRTDLTSVLTRSGQGITQAVLTLRVGTQRHLQATLPPGCEIWSLAVDGQAVQPSTRTDKAGQDSLLIPLPQQAADDVTVDLVYVGHLTGAANWSGRHSLEGPRFDLPLKDIRWQVYVPDAFAYSDFGGTLAIDPSHAGRDIEHYDLRTYQQTMQQTLRKNEQVAQQQLHLGRALVQQGRQGAARQALTKGYNFSLGNADLNEDIRVDLDNLVRQQAKLGLVNSRNRLREQAGAGPDTQQPQSVQQQFVQQQADRLDGALGQADSDNLELITRRILQTQAAAEAPTTQLQVTLPISGRILSFASPLQVEPAARMVAAFTARPRHLAQVDPSLWHGLGLFAILLAAGTILRWSKGPWERLHQVLTPTASQAEVGGRSDGSVSAEEIL